jgi:CubicO group peptidase (beta-lactamase class C family)
MGGAPLLDRRTIDIVSQQRSWGHDRILNVTNAFALVFMKSTPRVDLGSYQAFGHDGAGGVIAYADPLYDLALAYVPYPMRASASDPLYRRLRAAATTCVTGAADEGGTTM